MSISEYRVEHQPEKHRFVAIFTDGKIGMLQYQVLKGKKEVDMYHTEVPSEKKGKGVAEALGKAAMDWVTSSGQKAHLSCTYLSDTFLPRHPEYKDVSLTDSWDTARL